MLWLFENYTFSTALTSWRPAEWYISQELIEHSLSISSYSAGRPSAVPTIEPPKLTCLWTHITNILNYVIYSFKLRRTNINIVHRQHFAHFWFVQRWENWRELMRPHVCRGDLHRWDSGLGSTASRQTTCHSGQLIVSWSCVVSWTAVCTTCHQLQLATAARMVRSPNYAKYFCNSDFRTNVISC